MASGEMHVNLKEFQGYDEERKDAVYEALLGYIPMVHEVPTKSLREILQLTLAVMAYKGGRLEALEHRWEASKRSSDNEQLSEYYRPSTNPL